MKMSELKKVKVGSGRVFGQKKVTFADSVVQKEQAVQKGQKSKVQVVVKKSRSSGSTETKGVSVLSPLLQRIRKSGRDQRVKGSSRDQKVGKPSKGQRIRGFIRDQGVKRSGKVQWVKKSSSMTEEAQSYSETVSMENLFKWEQSRRAC